MNSARIQRTGPDEHLPKDLVRIPGLPWILTLIGIALAITVLGSIMPAQRAGSLVSGRGVGPSSTSRRTDQDRDPR